MTCQECGGETVPQKSLVPGNPPAAGLCYRCGRVSAYKAEPERVVREVREWKVTPSPATVAAQERKKRIIAKQEDAALLQKVAEL